MEFAVINALLDFPKSRTRYFQCIDIDFRQELPICLSWRHTLKVRGEVLLSACAQELEQGPGEMIKDEVPKERAFEIMKMANIANKQVFR